jgi:hypothetical protein
MQRATVGVGVLVFVTTRDTGAMDWLTSHPLRHTSERSRGMA